VKNRSLRREYNADHGLVLFAAAKRAGRTEKLKSPLERTFAAHW
jgi:hypothetical protein